MRYLIRRIVHGLLILLGGSLLSFILTQLAPGDFFQEMRLNPRISPATVDALRVQYGMDRPLAARYVLWVKSVAEGDFGYSFAYGTPVATLLWPRVRNTLLLASTAAALAWLIALPAGIWCAGRRGGWPDRLFAAGTSTLMAIPDLVLSLGLLFLAVRTGFLPTGGMISVGFEDLSLPGKVRDIAAHLALPCSALVLSTLPMLVRHVRAGMVEVLDAPFVRTAVAHGIPRQRMLRRQVLPNAANPLISLFGMSFGTLLSASLLIEVVMSWPGLGPMLLEAILSRDMYLVVGAITFSAVFLVAGNLFADLLLYAADPRIRKP